MLESKFGSPINSFLSILFDFVLIEVLPTSFFDLNISNSQCAECQFSTIADNDRGYAHPAVCGRIRCRTARRWMRAQNLLNARQPAGVHRRVLAAGRSVVIQSSFIFVELIFCLSTQWACFVSCLFSSATQDNDKICNLFNHSNKARLKANSWTCKRA